MSASCDWFTYNWLSDPEDTFLIIQMIQIQTPRGFTHQNCLKSLNVCADVEN